MPVDLVLGGSPIIIVIYRTFILKSPGQEDWIKNESLLHGIGKLTRCFINQLFCMVCHHVLGVSGNQVGHRHVGDGRRIRHHRRALWFLPRVFSRPVPQEEGHAVVGLASLVLYALAWLAYVSTPAVVFTDASSVQLWIFVVLGLAGAIAGNLRGITLSTLVTIMVPEKTRDRANGLVGTANGVAFFFASIFSGLAIGFVGVHWMLVIALVLTLVVIAHLLTIPIPDIPKPESAPAHAHAQRDHIDIRGTIAAVQIVPGLFGLIFFHTFNNFLGGVFMSLMDAYGLLLVSVQVWGILWGFLSLGFIVGGLIVAKKGLGVNPLRTLFLANIVMWTICSIFTLQASIPLLAVGMFIWLCLIPAVEAAEQTILQKVVPPERQGRVFGFAQGVEQAASPVTSFLIGPIAQLIFIPFMTIGAGVDLFGSWFGSGTDRGLALLFTVAGLIGLVVTLWAMRSYSYRALSKQYQQPELMAA